MEKVIVLGCAGSGKSRFSIELHRRTGLPLYHLDNIWWRADGTHISRDLFDERLGAILRGDRWIIDGDYSRTYEPRIAAADTVIFLDYAQEVCLAGIRERVGVARPDMPWVEKDVDPELVQMVLDYPAENRPAILELLSRYPDKTVCVFTDRRQAAEWLAQFNFHKCD